jgi:RNA polymerase sigma factor (sigma-70 family)
VDYKRLVEDNLPLVDSVVRTIGRRHGLSADEVDELGSSIRLKLVERDYEVLRKFEHRSQLRTYLITVVQRHFLDERNARWGKWRPSAVARRLGAVAVLLDRLLTRDHVPFDEAVQAIAARFGDAVSRADLQTIASQLPVRSSRVFVREEVLEHVPAPSTDGADAIESHERQGIGDRVGRALAEVLRGLSSEDRAMLRLRFWQNVQIARIAEMMGVPAKPLYRRFEELKDDLKTALLAQGVSAQDVVAILQHPDLDMDDLLEAAEAGTSGKT